MPVKPLHPAKYGDQILAALGRLVREEADALERRPLVLDPFAGVGRIHELRAWADTVGVEIEAEWAALRRGTFHGDATALPPNGPVVGLRGTPDEFFTIDDWTARFDVVATSVTYGNRMADHHQAKDPSTRRSYTHDLRAMTGDPDRVLAPNNTGKLTWGPAYRELEGKALAEMWRVLRPGGLLLLVLSDSFRTRGKLRTQVPCVEWHLLLALGRGWLLEGALPLGTPRFRFGANRDDRAAAEFVLQLRKPDAATEPVLYPEDPSVAQVGSWPSCGTCGAVGWGAPLSCRECRRHLDDLLAASGREPSTMPYPPEPPSPGGSQ